MSEHSEHHAAHAAAAAGEHGHAVAAGDVAHAGGHGHAAAIDLTQEDISLGERAWPVYNIAKIAGFVGIIGGVLLGYFLDPGFRRFYFAYLVSFMFFLSIALGALIFVLLQHLTRAGWSVSVRRSAEGLATTMPILLALSAPVLLSVLIQKGDLYRWAQPLSHRADTMHAEGGTQSAAGVAEEQGAAGAHQGTQGAPPAAQPHGGEPAHAGAAAGAADDHHAANTVPPLDELTLAKRPMLNPWFFTVRIVFYFAVWTAIALWYWRRSAEQDRTGAIELTERMQERSAPLLLVLGLTITFAAFDLIMSLDPHWFSTMMGIYYIVGCILASFAALILCLGMLQRLGYLRRSVTVEHYHDLGKWLFGFVFFWGYIAFSQYMLIWYANIPEETAWYARRGASTAAEHMYPPDGNGPLNGWVVVSLILLFGQFIIPFVGLMSRHVKRRRPILMFWAAWVLVFHWVDLYWLIMPELDVNHATGMSRVHFGVVELLCFLGVGGIFLATYLRFLAKNALRPLHDPRIDESVIFQNI